MAKNTKNGKAALIERVRNALQSDPADMPRVDYIAALEELHGELEMMLEAAREEQAEESGAS